MSHYLSYTLRFENPILEPHRCGALWRSTTYQPHQREVRWCQGRSRVSPTHKARNHLGTPTVEIQDAARRQPLLTTQVAHQHRQHAYLRRLIQRPEDLPGQGASCSFSAFSLLPSTYLQTSDSIFGPLFLERSITNTGRGWVMEIRIEVIC